MRGELVVEREIAHPPDRVWEQLTTAQGADAFFGADGFALRVGHRFSANVPRGPGFDGRVQAEILEFTPPQSLRMYWSGGPISGEVRLQIDPIGTGGSRVRLTQTGFDRAEQRGFATVLMVAWQQRLGEQLPSALSAAAVGGTASGGGASILAVSALASVTALIVLILAFVGLWSILSPAAPGAARATPPIDQAGGQPPRGSSRNAALGSGPRSGTTVPGLAKSTYAANAHVPTGAVTFYEEAMPTTLNPIFANTSVDIRVQSLVFDRLFARSAITNEWQSALVSSSERSDDGQALTITLDSSATWHDGAPVRASDLCFTIRAAQHPATAASPQWRDVRERVAQCTVTHNNRAVVTFVGPTADPFALLAVPVLPAHAFGDRPAIAPDHPFTSHPIGSGPMRVRKTRRALIFDAAPSARHSPRLTGLVLKEGGDPFVAVRTLIIGEIDGLITVSPVLRPDVRAATNVALKSYSLREWWSIAINTHNPALAHREVREAVDLSLDRDELVQLTIGVLPDDLNPPVNLISGPFVGSSAYYNRGVGTSPTSDRSRAAVLMRQAGAVLQGGVWHLHGSPIRLRLGMDATLDNQARDLLNQVRNQLTAAGFSTSVALISSHRWSQEALPGRLGGEFDLLIGKWVSNETEDVAPIFYSRSASTGQHNVFGWSEPKTDALLDAWRAAPTDRQARDAAHDLHAHLAFERPHLFLWTLSTKSAWSDKVAGTVISPRHYWTAVDRWHRK